MPAPFRKTCSNCVRSKRRCDLVLPQCHRCRVRSLDCQYPNGLSFSFVRHHQSTSAQKPDRVPTSNDEISNVGNFGEQVMEDMDFNALEVSLPSFPDYDLDWPDVMGNLEDYWVPDQIKLTDSPTKSVLAGEIYQERIIYSIKRMKDYPNLFVSQGSTPFIHEQLYSEYMPSVIQDILGVCALYGRKSEQNQALIFRTISLKAARLVAEYSTQALSPIEQLASMQALVLYQIIRLLDGDIRQRADAEKTDMTLRQWTEQLKMHMQQIDIVSNTDQNLPALSTTIGSWRNWIFAECIRRTIIVSFSIQGLYCFLKNGWDDSHHEFQRLTFYAQKALWNAPSEHYWQSAINERPALPICFSSWDINMIDAEPSDIEDLGMTMMVLVKGVDECRQWLGTQNLEKFGLASHKNR